MRFTRREAVTGAVAAAAGICCIVLPPLRGTVHRILVRLRGDPSAEDRLREFSAARARVAHAFEAAGVAYPPRRAVLLGLKDERRLEVYAGPSRDTLQFVADYPILAASGKLGPKLKEGDRQVPEGVYGVDSLNPNSEFHVALRLGYPNEFDRRLARRDGRTELGGDIMIHGGAASVGCLAMGDPAAEDLFVLVAAAGVEHVSVILSPVDLRRRPPPALAGGTYAELYADLQSELARLKRQRGRHNATWGVILLYCGPASCRVGRCISVCSLRRT